ncbi:unnamed protein product [Brachionus calyciflorus]|uniref:Latrophilin Cirl n=1 Tax=Brachionus calyciflorus TaxID=104777 RepID=A0A813M7I4_9BILA|nr:unnamed protein product [Brachionus calyciflorus]
MKWYFIFVFIQPLFNLTQQTDTFSGQTENAQNDKNLHNRMVCENEKLVLNCQNDQVIKIERAYYGRYSITPCNKNHVKFTKGCVANDSMEIIQKLCEFKSSCNHRITTSLFHADPCPGVDKVLEVNYKCKSLIEPIKTTKIALVEEEDILVEISKETQVPSKISLTQTTNTKTTITTTTTTTAPTTTSTTTTTTTTTETIQCYSKFEYDKNMYEITVDMGKLVSFPCTFQNDFYKQKDPKLVIGSHLYKCEEDGNLYKVNSTCRIRTENSDWFDSLKDEFEEDKNSVKIFQKLNKDLKDYKKSHSQSIKAVINFIKNATDFIDKNQKNISVTFVETVDTIIGQTNNWNNLEQSDKTKSITKLIDLVDEVLFMDDKLSIARDNLIAEVNVNKDLRNDIEFPIGNYLQSKTDERVFLNIENPNENQKFLFAIYKNVNELFPTKTVADKETPNNRFINSNIMSFKTNDAELIDGLKINPIRLLFKHLTIHDNENLAFKPICSYWKYDKDEYDGDWSTDGCELEFTNQTHSMCKCNHLTHFSILMDIYDVHKTQPNHHKFILSVLTIVLSIISCICIIFTLLAFRFIRIIRRNRESSSTKDLTIITTHLCICLLSSLMLFLSGILVQQLGLRQFCSFIALLSHYTFLCSFFWMLLEGAQLYLMLVRIFILEKSPVNTFCLIAYGVPIIIVAISKYIDYYFLESNGYGTQDHCWISNYKNFNLTFIIPISLVLVANFSILTVVFYSMKNSMGLKQSRVHTNKKQEDFFKSLLSFWCLISTLLGLPWILGYFIIDNEKTLIFSYLFTIINSSQGTIIFIFNCLISKNVREEIFKMLRKQKNRLFASLIGHDGAFTSNSSTSSNYTSNNLKQSTIRNGNKNFNKKTFLDFCLNSFCFCIHPCNSSTPTSASSSEKYSSDQGSKRQTSNYLITPQYSSQAKQGNLQDLDENAPLNQIQPQIYLNHAITTYPKHNIRMLSSLPYMKRTSSLMSSSTVNSNNPTQTTYISPVILINTSVPTSPPPPPPELLTFKSNNNPIRRAGNYDENQYLTPEYHNYSALDTDFNTDTQYYMENGLGCGVDDDDDDESNNTNNYDELLDHDLVYLRYCTKKENYISRNNKGSYLKVLNNISNNKLPSSSIGSSTNSSTSSSLANENSQIKLLSHNENLKAKKILQRPL